MRYKLAFVAALVLQFFASTSSGQVPHLITYEGELTDNECLAEGVYAMDFSIWSALEGGTMIDQFSDPAVAVTQGRFTVDLPVSGDTFLSSNRYVQITVEGDTLSPRERITSSAYSLRTRGLWVDENNNVGIKTSTPDVPLHVVGDTKLRGDVHVRDQLSLGVADPSVLFGQLTIADSGDGAPFAISAEWDNDAFATIFASNAGSGGVLYAQGASDASPAGGGLIVAGDEAGANIAIDANEIMARNGGATSTLYLNNEGGDVVVGGGNVHMGYEIVSAHDGDALSLSVQCPPGKRAVGGGCNMPLETELVASFPNNGGQSWTCVAFSSTSLSAYAICVNIR